MFVYSLIFLHHPFSAKIQSTYVDYILSKNQWGFRILDECPYFSFSFQILLYFSSSTFSIGQSFLLCIPIHQPERRITLSSLFREAQGPGTIFKLNTLEVCFGFLVETEFELRASCLQNMCSIAPVHFALGSLEIGSHKLFARFGLKP
jgi:hypothetical protein